MSIMKNIASALQHIADFIPYANYTVTTYKCKPNLELLKIIREEGLHADAMSPGEIYMLLVEVLVRSNTLYRYNVLSRK